LVENVVIDKVDDRQSVGNNHCLKRRCHVMY